MRLFNVIIKDTFKTEPVILVRTIETPKRNFIIKECDIVHYPVSVYKKCLSLV